MSKALSVIEHETPDTRTNAFGNNLVFGSGSNSDDTDVVIGVDDKQRGGLSAVHLESDAEGPRAASGCA